MEKKIILNGQEVSGEIKQTGNIFEIVKGGKKYCFEVCHQQDDHILIKDENGKRVSYYLWREGANKISVDAGAKILLVEESVGRVGRPKDQENHPRAPMPGKILKIFKSVGETFKKGEPLVIMEAMKMEHTIKAGRDGKIKAIMCKVGEVVEGGIDLLSFED